MSKFDDSLIDPFQVTAQAYDLTTGSILIDQDGKAVVFRAFKRPGEHPWDSLTRVVLRQLDIKLRPASTPVLHQSMNFQTNIETYSYVIFADNKTPPNLFLKHGYSWYELAQLGADGVEEREFYDELYARYRAYRIRQNRRRNKSRASTDDAIA